MGSIAIELFGEDHFNEFDIYHLSMPAFGHPEWHYAFKEWDIYQVKEREKRWSAFAVFGSSGSGLSSTYTFKSTKWEHRGPPSCFSKHSHHAALVEALPNDLLTLTAKNVEGRKDGWKTTDWKSNGWIKRAMDGWMDGWKEQITANNKNNI